jgi:hypothetical protein
MLTNFSPSGVSRQVVRDVTLISWRSSGPLRRHGQVSATGKTLHMNKALSKSTIGCQNRGRTRQSSIFFYWSSSPVLEFRTHSTQNESITYWTDCHRGPLNGYSSVDLKLGFGSKFSKPATLTPGQQLSEPTRRLQKELRSSAIGKKSVVK